MDEYTYLRALREAGDQESLAGRVRDLREHGWAMSDLAEGIGVARQWLYILRNRFPNAHSPADAPEIEDLRADTEPDIPLKLDRAKLPPALADALSALWRLNVRDRSAGKSEQSRALDVFLELLLRRGVPNLAIAQEAGVTHRAVIARTNRAQDRSTLPSELHTEFLRAPRHREARELQPRIPGREAFALFQVVMTTYPRFYTLRSPDGGLYLFKAHVENKYLEETGLQDFELLESEEEFANEIVNAARDESGLFAVPAQWLYVESAPQYIWDKQNYDPIKDFFPEALEPKTALTLECFRNPSSVLRNNPPIEWKGGQDATS
jgi:hypothetical protein